MPLVSFPRISKARELVSDTGSSHPITLTVYTELVETLADALNLARELEESGATVQAVFDDQGREVPADLWRPEVA